MVSVTPWFSLPNQVYNIRLESLPINPSENLAQTVQPGLSVRVEIAYQSGAELENEQLEFVIVPDELADFPAGFLGQGTPLAQAILGEPVGRSVPYFTGDALSVTILSASPTSKAPDQDTAARRQERLAPGSGAVRPHQRHDLRLVVQR